MPQERSRPSQLSFLAPEDAETLHLMRRFVAEASRLYETRTGRSAESAIRIGGPTDAYDFLRGEMADLDQEQLRTLNLSVKNQILTAPLIYQGTVANTNVRVAEVFRPAILENAAGLIVAHNHPSGDPTPSSHDVDITRRIVEAGRLLDIDVLDHIIIGHDSYASLRERGLGFDGAR